MLVYEGVVIVRVSFFRVQFMLVQGDHGHGGLRLDIVDFHLRVLQV